MKLIVLGDSIAKGTFMDKRKGENSPRSVASPNFSEYLQKMLGAEELLNLAMNGISYSATSSVNAEWALSNTCRQAQNGDIIIIAAGTNDYGTNVELGLSDDCEDLSFYGAVDVVFQSVKRNNPNADIFIILPVYRQSEGKNEKGYVLDDYRQAIKYKAELYGLSVIDGRIIPELVLYMDDGLHPNEMGHKLYAEMIYAEMNSACHLL